jgi:outer membrane cobalamin receptor
LDQHWPVLIKPGSFRGALAVAVASCSLFETAVFAQQTAAPGEAEVERVIVTGSMIPSAEEVGPNPVFIINRDLINKSGAGTTAEQLLQRQPVIGGSNIPVTNNGTSGAGPAGTAALSLRGLDPGATLVLL